MCVNGENMSGQVSLNPFIIPSF